MFFSIFIKDGKVTVHSTRQPMTKRLMQIAISNIQRSLRLAPGADGGWKLEADLKLLRLLASTKKASTKGNNHIKSIKDAKGMLAIKDKSENDDDPTGLSSMPSGSTDGHVPQDIDHSMSDGVMIDNDGHVSEYIDPGNPEYIHPGNPEYEAMDIDPPSDPDSSSSSSSSCSKSNYSSSSSSTHKSTLRRRVLELEGMLESTTEDL